MASSVKLLLIENVENTGIVGDVVTVRKGYARNFLLPRGFATVPSDKLIKELQGKRAEALKQLDELKKERAGIIAKLAGTELTMIRSCNDAGILYAAVTQQDIATALTAAGHKGITAREIRIGQNIKRIDNYEIHVKFDSELDTLIKIHIQADRKLDLGKRDDDKHADDKKAVEGAEGDDKAADGKGAEGKSDGKGEGKDGKPSRPRGDRGGDRGGDRAEGGAGGGGGDRPERKERPDREGRGRMNIAKMDFTEKRVVGWGDAPAKTEGAADAAAGKADKGKGKGKSWDKGDKGADKGAEKAAEKPAAEAAAPAAEKPKADKGEKKAKK